MPRKQQRQRKQKQQGGAGDATYAAHVYPQNPTLAGSEYGAHGNVIQMNEQYATAQHNGPQVGGNVHSIAPLTHGGMPALPLTVGGKMDLTALSVPAALLVANQLYSRRHRKSGKGRRLSRKRRNTQRRR
jgi:hypothetical protein